MRKPDNDLLRTLRDTDTVIAGLKAMCSLNGFVPGDDFKKKARRVVDSSGKLNNATDLTVDNEE